MDGMDVDLTKEFAKRLGVKVKIETPAWEVITSGNWRPLGYLYLLNDAGCTTCTFTGFRDPLLQLASRAGYFRQRQFVD